MTAPALPHASTFLRYLLRPTGQNLPIARIDRLVQYLPVKIRVRNQHSTHTITTVIRWLDIHHRHNAFFNAGDFIDLTILRFIPRSNNKPLDHQAPSPPVPLIVFAFSNTGFLTYSGVTAEVLRKPVFEKAKTIKV